MASNRTKCELNDGTIRVYHAACSLDAGQVYDPQVFDYMGQGVVFSVGGILQWSTTQLRFYKLKDSRPRWAR